MRYNDDLIGTTYGKLTILGYSFRKYGKDYIKVRCDCVNKTVKDVRLDNIIDGTIKGCGCIKYEKHNTLNSYIGNDNITMVKLNNTDNMWMKCTTSDWDNVKEYPWSFRSHYPRATIDGKDYCFHNTLPQKEGFILDHIDRDRLNNTRHNFRYADKSLNTINSERKVKNSSGHRGIYKKSDTNFEVSININKKCISHSGFKTLDEAIVFRQKLVEKYYSINCEGLETIESYKSIRAIEK